MSFHRPDFFDLAAKSSEIPLPLFYGRGRPRLGEAGEGVCASDYNRWTLTRFAQGAQPPSPVK